MSTIFRPSFRFSLPSLRHDLQRTAPLQARSSATGYLKTQQRQHHRRERCHLHLQGSVRLLNGSRLRNSSFIHPVVALGSFPMTLPLRLQSRRFSDFRNKRTNPRGWSINDSIVTTDLRRYKVPLVVVVLAALFFVYQ